MQPRIVGWREKIHTKTSNSVNRFVIRTCHYLFLQQVAVFAAASEAFSAANVNCSIQESLGRFKPAMEKAKAAGLPVRGYVSCVLGCPYEGRVAPEAVIEVSGELAMGFTIMQHHHAMRLVESYSSFWHRKRVGMICVR